MNLKDFARRDDLCPKGVAKLYLSKTCGVILKTKNGWFASKDSRWHLIGVKPNEMLEQPTIGPFESIKKALELLIKEEK